MTSPLRVLFLTPDWSETGLLGGIGAFTVDLSLALAAMGDEVAVLRWQDRLEPVAADRVSVYDLRRRRRSGRLRRLADVPVVARLLLAVAVAWRVRALGTFDVIEAPDWMAPGLFLRMARRGALVVTQIHGPMALLDRRPSRLRLHVRAAYALERCAVQWADLVISPSTIATNALAAIGWGTEGWRQLPCPVALPGGRSAAIPAEPVVAWCGRIDDLKDPWTLIRAATLLKEEFPDLKLLLAFDTRGQSSITSRVQRLEEEIRNEGLDAELHPDASRHGVTALFARARAVAVTSKFETFSMVAAEALRSGRPLVCTDQVGVAEWLEEDAGAVVPAGEAAALAAGLAPFLRSGGAAAGAAASALAARLFDAATVARQRRAMYSEAQYG